MTVKVKQRLKVPLQSATDFLLNSLQKSKARGQKKKQLRPLPSLGAPFRYLKLTNPGRIIHWMFKLSMSLAGVKASFACTLKYGKRTMCKTSRLYVGKIHSLQ